MSNFKDIVQQYAQKQAVLVDSITEGSPLFGTAMFEPTTHGYRHVYEEVSGIVGMQFVNLNAANPSVSMNTNLKQTDIAKMAGKLEVHVDTATEIGGASSDAENGRAYFNKKAQTIIKRSLMSASQQSYYNLFEPYARSKGKAVSAVTTPSGNKYFSVYVIRWEEGEFTGLFNPRGFGSVNAEGSMVKVTPLSMGGRYTNSEGKSVIGWDMEMPFGFLPANPQNISTIVNVDSTANLDEGFAELLSNALVNARAGSGGRTYIYMAPALRSKLGRIKSSALSIDPSNSAYNRLITSWDGVEIIADYNLLAGTEAAITI
jgi:hypothetical protein